MIRSSCLLGIFLSRGTLVLAVVLGGLWAAPRDAQAREQTNACGCYQDTAGMCLCERASKCGCPGECEPKSCVEKRQKELDKEIQAETQKVLEAERKQREEAEEKERKADQQIDDEEEPDETPPLASLCE